MALYNYKGAAEGRFQGGGAIWTLIMGVTIIDLLSDIHGVGASTLPSLRSVPIKNKWQYAVGPISWAFPLVPLFKT